MKTVCDCRQLSSHRRHRRDETVLSCRRCELGITSATSESMFNLFLIATLRCLPFLLRPGIYPQNYSHFKRTQVCFVFLHCPCVRAVSVTHIINTCAITILRFSTDTLVLLKHLTFLSDIKQGPLFSLHSQTHD